jgi:hypothetical protein
MKVISLILTFACCAFGQAKLIMSGSVSKDGVHVAFRTMMEPPSSGEDFSLGGGTASSEHLWHRYLYHSKTRKYFGYDIDIQRKQGDQFVVRLLPLSADPQKLTLPAGAAWTLMQLPRGQEPQTIRTGETVAVDLLVNQSTGHKVVDYLTISGEQREVYTVEGSARTFSAEDAPLNLYQPRISINGELVPSTANMGGGVSGTAVAFYLPGKGRFVLSLAPREALGFRRAGEVRGSTLTFTAGSDTYRVNCNGRIAPGEGVYHLYLYHNPSFRPKNPGPSDAVGMVAGDAAGMVRRY